MQSTWKRTVLFRSLSERVCPTFGLYRDAAAFFRIFRRCGKVRKPRYHPFFRLFRDGETRSLPFSALFFLRPAFLRIGKTKGRLVRFTD
ncbi:hypothetical protein B4135_3392 [Caldibacillus debilis]|uniref:Uncharacterized protein n=1 Tax=Caldibacillus debilis TaxID=301148 RepID=A0A150LE19_9BACI|nr:hypothetical protein B4135_3392 [Caldibacillus debilis]